MKEKGSKRSKGFGFVTFEVWSEAEAEQLTETLCQPKQPLTLLGRRVDVKLGDGLKQPLHFNQR